MGVQDEGFEAVDSTEYAATACGANYGEAFEYYKRAVDDSKDRLRYGVCQSENGFMWAIADNASRAVMTPATCVKPGASWLVLEACVTVTVMPNRRNEGMGCS